MVDLAALASWTRTQLVEKARELGIERPERMTRMELRDEIGRLTDPGASRDEPRGLLGAARSMIASMIEAGLNMPEAAAVIRGETGFDVRVKTPVATVTLAEIYAAQGHRQRALRMLDDVLAVEPDHEVARELRQRLEQESHTKTEPPRSATNEFVDTTGEEIRTGKPPVVAPVEDLASKQEDPATPEPAAQEEPAPPARQAAQEAPDALQDEPAAQEAPAVEELPATEEKLPTEELAAREEPATKDEPAGVAQEQEPVVREESTPQEASAAEQPPAPPRFAISFSFGDTQVAAVQPPSQEPPAEQEQPAPQEQQPVEQQHAALRQEPPVERREPALPEEQPEPERLSVQKPAAPEPVATDATTSEAPSSANGSSTSDAKAEGPSPERDALFYRTTEEGTRLYWEVSAASLDRLSRRMPEGHAVIRVVGLQPDWRGPRRVEIDVPVEAATGVTELSELHTPTIVRAALGWLAPEGFTPLAVGSELDGEYRPPIGGDVPAAEARARQHID